LEVGSILFLKSVDPVPIKQIVDDTHLVLKYPVKSGIHDVPFKAAPRVEQDEFFKEIFKSLQMGKAVGVFPEGGSHDNTHFLELKPGVAIFCLGGSIKSGKPVPVVPVGLNYFKGHRFHSRVFVDYGAPIYPSEELLRKYQSQESEEKREATSSLLKQIKEGLSNVTVETPDFDTLQLFWALRRLYVPSGEKLDDSMKQSLTRGFAEGYSKFKDNERVKKLLENVQLYMNLLKQYGLRDFQVSKTMKSRVEAGDSKIVDRTALVVIFARRLLFLLIWGVIWIPAGITSLPFIMVTRVIAQRQAKLAVLKSSVKIAGRDVVGTWKVLVAIGLWPTLHFGYTFLVYWYFGEVWAAAYFFFMPFISFFNLKSQENMAKLFRSIAPIFFLMKDPDLATRLVYLRDQCRQETTAVVEEVGWGTPMEFRSEEPPLRLPRSMSFDDLWACEFSPRDRSGSGPSRQTSAPRRRLQTTKSVD
jgi:glycerol-3-phosphate O-acyltransferase/dihydroxyacetone phosphate acyltransferase